METSQKENPEMQNEMQNIDEFEKMAIEFNKQLLYFFKKLHQVTPQERERLSSITEMMVNSMMQYMIIDKNMTVEQVNAALLVTQNEVIGKIVPKIEPSTR